MKAGMASCAGAGSERICPASRRPTQCPEDAATGLRLTYLGGAVVELAGALIALACIRGDSMEQRKTLSRLTP
jgi:hypothetical protein